MNTARFDEEAPSLHVEVQHIEVLQELLLKVPLVQDAPLEMPSGCLDQKRKFVVSLE